MKNGRAPHLSQKKSERRAGGPPNSLAMDVMVNLQKDMQRIKFREGVWRMSPKKLDIHREQIWSKAMLEEFLCYTFSALIDNFWAQN